MEARWAARALSARSTKADETSNGFPMARISSRSRRGEVYP
jgi:hypothetical protein